MRVLITGGAGYIGSHTAKALWLAGFEPVVYDNLSTGHRWAVKWGPLVEADISDCSALKHAIRQYDITAAIHFAAHAYVGESMHEPRRYFQNNVIGTLNLLEALLDAAVRRFVFSSSCAVYGIPNVIPIPEDHPKLPVNPYGESKLFIERALDWYGRAYDFRWAALRYFNAAGADSNGESFAVNLGTGHGVSVREVIAAVQRIAGVSIDARPAPRRPGDPAVLVACPARADALLRWRPKFSALDRIVSTAWHWRNLALPNESSITRCGKDSD